MERIRAHRTLLYAVGVIFLAIAVVLYVRERDWIGAALFAGMAVILASFLVTARREDRDR